MKRIGVSAYGRFGEVQSDQAAVSDRPNQLGEGSRPRDPSSSEPRVRFDTVFDYVRDADLFTAREDARPPKIRGRSGELMQVN